MEGKKEPPPHLLGKFNLLNSHCNFFFLKAFDTPPLTPVANKIIAQTLLEKKNLDLIMKLIICIYVKQKSNLIHVLLFGSQLRIQGISITVILFIVSSQILM